jgi:transposase InsO family protein
MADALDRVLRTSAILPRSITVDHGIEFTSRALKDWAYGRGVQLDFIHPGKPTAYRNRRTVGAAGWPAWTCKSPGCAASVRRS